MSVDGCLSRARRHLRDRHGARQPRRQAASSRAQNAGPEDASVGDATAAGFRALDLTAVKRHQVCEPAWLPGILVNRREPRCVIQGRGRRQSHP